MTSNSRLLTLDAMRGVAAAMVVVHHLAPSTMGRSLLPRGYLAVDFFFMLSGFVLARSFEPRFAAGLDAGAFMTARLRRLYPTMALGVLLGALVTAARGVPATSVMGVLATELLFIPWLGGGMGGIFRFDGVQWSLLFELLVNLAHAAGLSKVPARNLLIVAAVALVALALVARAWGCLAVGDRGASVIGGLPRVLFAYLIGIVLARRGCVTSIRVGAAAPVALLATAIVLPGLAPASPADWIVDLAIVATVFPAAILLGAASHPEPHRARIAALAGALSYPLYATHVPAMNLTLLLAERSAGGGAALFAACLAAAAAIATAIWLATEWARGSRRRIGGRRPIAT